jgi:hypothetical protein
LPPRRGDTTRGEGPQASGCTEKRFSTRARWSSRIPRHSERSSSYAPPRHLRLTPAMCCAPPPPLPSYRRRRLPVRGGAPVPLPPLPSPPMVRPTLPLPLPLCTFLSLTILRTSDQNPPAAPRITGPIPHSQPDPLEVRPLPSFPPSGVQLFPVVDVASAGDPGGVDA